MFVYNLNQSDFCSYESGNIQSKNRFMVMKSNSTLREKWSNFIIGDIYFFDFADPIIEKIFGSKFSTLQISELYFMPGSGWTGGCSSCSACRARTSSATSGSDSQTAAASCSEPLATRF